MLNRKSGLILIIILITALLGGCGSADKTTSNVAPAQKGITGPATDGSTVRLVPNQEQATVEIWIDNVTSLYALDLELQFDPAHLQVTDADSNQTGIQVQAGQAPAPDFVAENMVDNQTGVIHYVVTQLAPRDGFSGSGRIATIAWSGEFDAAALSVAAITLSSQDGQPIEVALARSES